MSVDVGPESRGLECGEPLAEQGSDHPREHVARSAGRHAGIAGSIHARAFAVADDRSMTLQYEGSVEAVRERFRGHFAIRDVGVGSQPSHLAGVGCQNEGRARRLECVDPLRKAVQRVGVDHGRARDRREQLHDKLGSRVGPAEPRAEYDRLASRGELEQRLGRFGCRHPVLGFRQCEGHRAGLGCGDDCRRAPGKGDRDEAGAATKRGRCREASGARHSARAADDQHASERALVGGFGARWKIWKREGLVFGHERGFSSAHDSIRPPYRSGVKRPLRRGIDPGTGWIGPWDRDRVAGSPGGHEEVIRP